MARNYAQFKGSATEDKLFDVAPFDATSGRTKLKARFTRALKQFNKEQGLQGGKDFEVGHNEAIRFKPTLNGKRIYIEETGEDYFFVAKGQFEELISALLDDVEAGEFDNQLQAALTTDTGTAPSNTPQKKARKSQAKGEFNNTDFALNSVIGAARRHKWTDEKLIKALKDRGIDDAKIASLRAG
jgi:hypothetical protein